MNRELLETPFTPAQIKQHKGRNGMLTTWRATA
jgi:hypothetical protein